ncbi:hypothetical protein TNCV_1099821 [Trichonephila clavipes]|nr:hypothetical protein TNCV_1099821 [Trichonephila clavipes]
MCPSCEKCWIQVSPVPASDEVCPPVCASYEMCSRVFSTNLKCIMTFLLRERKDVLLEVAKELRVEIDITLPKIEFKKRICQSKYYDEESVKCLLEDILEEKREEREKQEFREFEERRLARELELERMRIQLRNKLNENKLKAGNRINDLANVCILSGKCTAEVLGFHQLVKDKCDPSIVPEFLGSASCGMTSARGHGAIVYCLNSGSGQRQTGRHNSKVEPAPH